jgi:ABC-type dipeptide/oligopeptide/nickel transport system permease subunit
MQHASYRPPTSGRNILLTAPWVVIYLALAISSLVIDVNLLADGLATGKGR